jgi:glycosidase
MDLARKGRGGWRRTASIYQVDVRSSADSDGDGDLAELRDRLPYLAELGVDAIWVTPSPTSPIDPTLGDAAKLISEAQDLGLRVIVDIVPDHTSRFDHLRTGWDAAELREVITRSLALADSAGAPTTWGFSDHDVVRHLTRFGGGEVGWRRARAAALLTLALPGSAYLYQGEELGPPEVPGLPAGWKALTAEAQRDDPHSMLSLYRQALRIRRGHPALGGGELHWLPGLAGCLLFERTRGGGPRLLCALNLSTETVTLPIPGALMLSSTPLYPETDHVALPPDTATWWSLTGG